MLRFFIIQLSFFYEYFCFFMLLYAQKMLKVTIQQLQHQSQQVVMNYFDIVSDFSSKTAKRSLLFFVLYDSKLNILDCFSLFLSHFNDKIFNQ